MSGRLILPFTRQKLNLNKNLAGNLKESTYKLYISPFFRTFVTTNKKYMVFDKITEDGRLWAVRFDENADNEFIKTIDQWDDVQWLRAFFIENISDLIAYFKISDINIAISDTIDDSDRLQRIILDISPGADLNRIFRPLDNNQASDAMLQKEKARLKRKYGHSSWLRLYAIKLVSGVYIITGGAIKLTATMQEREHTSRELAKLERVRNFLLQENVIDDTGFIDYMTEL